jgi:hypothetical protein
MARIEATLNHNATAPLQPHLNRAPLRRALLPRLCARLHCDLYKPLRIAVPQSLLPLIELPQAQTTFTAVHCHALTAPALLQNQFPPLRSRFLNARSHPITMLEIFPPSKMRIT